MGDRDVGTAVSVADNSGGGFGIASTTVAAVVAGLAIARRRWLDG